MFMQSDQQSNTQTSTFSDFFRIWNILNTRIVYFLHYGSSVAF